MDELKARIEEIKSIWLSSELIPTDLTTWGIELLTKERVAYTFDECTQLLTKLGKIDWQGPVALAIYEAEVHLNAISNYVSTTLTQPNPEQHIASFFVQLNHLLNVLRNAAIYATDKVYNAERELLRVTSQIETSKTILQNLTKINEDVNSSKNQIDSSNTKIGQSEKAILELQEKLTNISTTLTPIETQIKELQTNAVQYVTQISTYKDEISDLDEQYKTLVEKTENEANTLDKLQEKCNEQQEEIQKTIEDASRLGMAGSFRMRKKELVRPMIIWGVTFFIGVLALSLLAYYKILPLLAEHSFDWFTLIGRLPILAPALWLSWFSVRQYGFTARLWEDYAYKYASAMAFEGYKREASNVNPEMLKLLMEISIINFASNPLRVYDSKTNHGSPLNELTNDSKGFLQNTLDIIKGVVTKDKK
jgi:uncharacterized coiled-coil DUF342 family protein